MALNAFDDAAVHSEDLPPLSDDSSLARAQLYLYACGIRGDALADMTRQLQAVADPDAPQHVRTRLLMERAMLLGRGPIDELALPRVLPAANVQHVHRQELGKPVAPLRPGWWWAPWRRFASNFRQRGDDD